MMRSSIRATFTAVTVKWPKVTSVCHRREVCRHRFQLAIISRPGTAPTAMMDRSAKMSASAAFLQDGTRGFLEGLWVGPRSALLASREAHNQTGQNDYRSLTQAETKGKRRRNLLLGLVHSMGKTIGAEPAAKAAAVNPAAKPRRSGNHLSALPC